MNYRNSGFPPSCSGVAFVTLERPLTYVRHSNCINELVIVDGPEVLQKSAIIRAGVGSTKYPDCGSMMSGLQQPSSGWGFSTSCKFV